MVRGGMLANEVDACFRARDSYEFEKVTHKLKHLLEKLLEECTVEM